MTQVPERRQGRRNLFTVTVDYALIDQDLPEASLRGGRCLTTNISDNGIGLILSSALDEGQSIVLYGDKLAENPLIGNVRWCTKISKGLYRTGLRLN